MPGGNRTGPDGRGAMTGRGVGYCAGYAMPGYMNPHSGQGDYPWYGYLGRGAPEAPMARYYGPGYAPYRRTGRGRRRAFGTHFRGRRK